MEGWREIRWSEGYVDWITGSKTNTHSNYIKKKKNIIRMKISEHQFLRKLHWHWSVTHFYWNTSLYLTKCLSVQVVSFCSGWIIYQRDVINPWHSDGLPFYSRGCWEFSQLPALFRFLLPSTLCHWWSEWVKPASSGISTLLLQGSVPSTFPKLD